MSKFKRIFRKFLGFEEENDEKTLYEEYAEEKIVQPDQKTVYPGKEANNRRELVNEQVTLFPKAFGDACEVVEYLEEGYIVTINMNDVDIDTCKRITDFVLGAVYVLNGDVEKISGKIFRFWLDA